MPNFKVSSIWSSWFNIIHHIAVAPTPVATATATATASSAEVTTTVADEMNVSSDDTIGKQSNIYTCIHQNTDLCISSSILP